MTYVRRICRARCCLPVVLTLAGLTGCAGLLPKTHSEASSFKTFDEAKQAIESLIPMTSRRETLAALGIEAGRQPNTLLLTHADIVRRFVSGSLLTKQDLDPGVVMCIEARDDCHGLELQANSINKDRTGSFFADFFNFSRRTETKGWRFNALILLVNDLVVYRNWGGVPVIDETEIHTNPLGPLQDMGPSVVTSQ